MRDDVEEEESPQYIQVQEKRAVHPGASLLGVILTLIALWSLYESEMEFAGFIIICLLTLGISSKLINHHYR